MKHDVIQHITRLKGFESELLFAGNSAAISFELMQFTVNCSLRKWSLMIIWKNCTNIRLNEVQLLFPDFAGSIEKVWSWKIHFHPMYAYVNFTLKMQRTSKMFHVNKLSVSHQKSFPLLLCDELVTFFNLETLESASGYQGKLPALLALCKNNSMWIDCENSLSSDPLPVKRRTGKNRRKYDATVKLTPISSRTNWNH